MASVRAKVTVKTGRPPGGTVLASGTVKVISTGGRPRFTGKPLYKTSAQLNLHLDRGRRPTKTELRRLN